MDDPEPVDGSLSLAPSLLPSMFACLMSVVSLQLLLLCLCNLLLFHLLALTLLLLVARTLVLLMQSCLRNRLAWAGETSPLVWLVLSLISMVCRPSALSLGVLVFSQTPWLPLVQILMPLRQSVLMGSSSCMVVKTARLLPWLPLLLLGVLPPTRMAQTPPLLPLTIRSTLSSKRTPGLVRASE